MTVNCPCGKPAKIFTVLKQGPNTGRKFYKCSLPGQPCGNWFQWAQPNADQVKGDSIPSSTITGSKKPTTSNLMAKGASFTILSLFVINDTTIGIRRLKPTLPTELAGPLRHIPKFRFDDLHGCWVFGKENINQVVACLQEKKWRVELLPLNLYQLVMESSPQIPLNDEVEAMMNQRLSETLRKSLKPYQWEGIMTAISRNGRLLLADDMGLGKSLQAIAISLYYKQFWPCLIITPSSLRFTWESEIMKWTDDMNSVNIQVLTTSKDIVDTTMNYYITSYDLVQKVPELLEKCKLIIADESHFLKNKTTARVKCITPYLKNKDKKVILLSGTPAISRPVELFVQLNALNSSVFHSYHAFGKRYCDGKYTVFGWDFTGSSNLEELNWLMNKTVMLRRLKKDVLKELPSKIRQCIWIEVQKIPTVSKLQIDEAVKKGIFQNTNTTMMEMYRDTAKSKIKACLDYIDECLEDGSKKLLLFAHHQEFLDSIDSHMKKKKISCIRIDGNTPTTSRQALCDQYQTKESVRVAILSITAAGVGLTLHKADVVIFCELFWNPSQLLQAEDRAHRIGREDCVNIKYLLAKKTFDEYQWPLVQKKLSVVGRSVDGKQLHYEMKAVEAKSTLAPATVDIGQKRISDFFPVCPKQKLARGEESSREDPKKDVITGEDQIIFLE